MIQYPGRLIYGATGGGQEITARISSGEYSRPRTGVPYGSIGFQGQINSSAVKRPRILNCPETMASLLPNLPFYGQSLIVHDHANQVFRHFTYAIPALSMSLVFK